MLHTYLLHVACHAWCYITESLVCKLYEALRMTMVTIPDTSAGIQ